MLFVFQSYAQLLHLNLTPQFINKYSSSVYFLSDSSISKFHSAIQPYDFSDFDFAGNPYRSEIRNIYYLDQVDSNAIQKYSSLKKIIRIIKPDISVEPLFSNKFISENNIGLNIRYSSYHDLTDTIRKINSFAGEIKYNYYSLCTFPDYIKTYIDKTHMVPGQGYANPVNWFYNYHEFSFYAAKSVGKYFAFEGGFGKHFFGDGYRSLFLSDASYNYPYFQITTTIWKIKYVNLFTNFKDITNGYDNWFKAENKYGAFHFLSWDATKRLNLNFFEAIIWADRGFDVNYMNPIIFYRPVEFSFGDATNPNPDNAFMGFGTHYTIGKSHVLYGQLLIDDFVMSDVKAGFSHMLHHHDSTIQWGSWMNKQAFQLGYKYFNVAGIKYLNFQTEYNYVRPYVYSQRDVIANYGNFNEPLADPLGANFWESVTFLKYTYKQWYFEIEYMHYLTGLDSNGTHFGQDIYKSTFDAYLPNENNIPVKEFGNKVGQGIKTTVNYFSPKVSYLIYPRLNLRIELGYIYRTQQSVIGTKNSNYIFFGIKTSLDNRHYDL